MSTRGRSAEPGNLELGVGRMTARGAPVDLHAVAIDVAEHAEIGRVERLQAVGRRLGDLARRLDLVVERNEHAEPARGRRRGRTDGAEQVHAGIAAQGAGGPLGSDHDHGLVGLERQMQEVGGLLQRRGAVRDDEARDRRLLGCEAMNDRSELEPFGRADLRAADAAERHRQHLGDLGDLGIAPDHLLDRQLDAEIGVVEHVGAVAAERGDGAAGSNGSDEGTIRHGSSK